MIELIINNGVITVNKKINILPINTEKNENKHQIFLICLNTFNSFCGDHNILIYFVMYSFMFMKVN